MKLILKIAKDLGYEVSEGNISLEELKEADELFFTGTATEVIPIVKLDDKEFEKGEATGKIREKYLDIVHGKDKKYEKWLSYV